MTQWLGAAALVLLAAPLAAGMPEAQALYKKGNEAYRARDYRTAVDCYLKVVAEEGSYADYIDKPLGNAYLGLQDEGKALFHLNRALERSPNDEQLKATVKALEARDVLPDSSGTNLSLAGEKLFRHHIYLNSGDIFRGAMSLGYEHALGDHATWLLDGVYGARSDSSGSYNTLGGGLGIHFWPRRLVGIFAGPKFTYQVANYEDTRSVYNTSTFKYETVKTTGSVSRVSMGAEMGFQWRYNSGLTMAIGYGYFYNQFTGGDPNLGYYYSSTYYGSSGTATQSSFLWTLGYAF